MITVIVRLWFVTSGQCCLAEMKQANNLCFALGTLVVSMFCIIRGIQVWTCTDERGINPTFVCSFLCLISILLLRSALILFGMMRKMALLALVLIVPMEIVLLFLILRRLLVIGNGHILGVIHPMMSSI